MVAVVIGVEGMPEGVIILVIMEVEVIIDDIEVIIDVIIEEDIMELIIEVIIVSCWESELGIVIISESSERMLKKTINIENIGFLKLQSPFRRL